MKMELRLLLVEDYADDAELILLKLREAGFNIHCQRVETKNSTQNALDSSEWDLVISDFVLPGYTGLEALDLVRQFNPFLPFILVSGAIGEIQAVEIMKKGAQDYVLKNNLIRLPSSVSRALSDAEIRRKALRDERRLVESHEQLKAIFESTSDAMGLIRVNKSRLIIESVNKAFYEVYRKRIGPLDSIDVIGFDLVKLMRDHMKIAKKQIDRIFSLYQEAIQSDKTIKFVEEFKMSPQPIISELQLIPISHKRGGPYVLFVNKDVTDSILAERELIDAYYELKQLKIRLEHENKYLKEEIDFRHNFNNVIYQSNAIKKVLKLVEQVAPVDATVLVTGETGTGKELMVRAIHKNSLRGDKAFVKINCGALPRDLIESELFGYEKGAFTGAISSKLGRFDLAHNGTIFLDEIAELPLELQSKLLRVLQEGEFLRLGGTKVEKVDVRVIAATNKNLSEEIRKGNFREDLFYRLNVFPIEIPPLRNRIEDIEVLSRYFVKRISTKLNKSVVRISTSDMESLKKYHWPGNVRELENLVERALIVSQNGKVSIAPLLGVQQINGPPSIPSSSSLKQLEKEHIQAMLESCDWKINGMDGAAKRLGIHPSTLRDRMKKHGIFRPE